ncbi:hypothetical protein O1R50_18915 [Glycomyces luteolus]|uniref:Uncharacterized protein n=1 Tax=Glycomyces luteolus TaxID=2670330 RepID=A0A9X3SRI8_9ACTN|nr:hypothetical protein [Glycomyces luteolus]MDA1361707.1 hypothetical protein [Glycomyces luteolus]
MAATLKRHHRRRAPLAVYAPLALTERPALQRYRGNDSIKTTAQRHPSETPAQYPPLPYQYPRPHDPRRKARLVRLWLHLVASLVVWPAIFGTVVIATFVGVVVVYNEFAGPLFWPLA